MPKFSMPKISLKMPSVGSIIYWVIGIGLAVGVMLFARSFTDCWSITDLEGAPPASCGQAGQPIFNPEGTPVATVPVDITPVVSAPEVQAPEWDGGSRVNVLFIGVDYRDWEAGTGAPRSDTMILFTLDPVTKTAGMLSIPRDMWVNIPGSGYGRINTAYSIGEGSKYAGGGGPGLAMKTVEQFLGVPVHYYAQVEFNTFIEMVDTIGGIDVLITERLRLDPLGSGKDKIILTPGLRHLNGEKALAYARTRKTEGGDVDRAQRQQDVIFAIMEKVFSPDYFPTFVKQAPELYQRLSGGIHTSISFEDGLRLAYLLSEVDRNNIKTGVINYDMVTLEQAVTADGQSASVFKARPDQIRILRDEIFSETGPTSPVMLGQDPLKSAQTEGSRIRVLNGTFAGDFGQRAAVYLQSLGLTVTEVGSTGATDRTIIKLYSSKLYTMRFLLYLFGLNGASGTTQIRFEPTPGSTVDVEIILGTDALNSNVVP